MSRCRTVDVALEAGRARSMSTIRALGREWPCRQSRALAIADNNSARLARFLSGLRRVS